MAPFDASLLLLTFALGFTLLRANLCTVACLRNLILHRRAEGIFRLAIATSAAGTVLLAAYLLWPARVMLPIDSSLRMSIIVGGVILGVGSLINGACYLGSITYLGTGNLNYLLTLLGIGLGLRLTGSLPDWSLMMVPATRLRMSREVLIGLPVLALMLLLGVWLVIRAGVRDRYLSWRRPRAWPLAAAVSGTLAGCVFARHPNWTYGNVIDSLAHADLHPIDWLAALSACALFLGAIASAWLLHRLQLKPLSPLKATRCLMGGALMAYGATLIPGGNDSLLLWAIPSLSHYGLLAYGAMAATIAAAVVGERLFVTPPADLPPPPRN